MADLNIVRQGEKVKYIVTSQNINFDMESCDFYVELLYGMMGKKLVIQKSDFLYGTGGEYIMLLIYLLTLVIGIGVCVVALPHQSSHNLTYHVRGVEQHDVFAASSIQKL